MVKVEETALEAQFEDAPVQTEVKEEANPLTQRLLDAGVPKDVVKEGIPVWKERHKDIQVAWLGSGPYLYRKLLWADLRAITNSLSTMAKSQNATDTNIQMLQLEMQLEKAVLWPVVNSTTAAQFPSGDLEALQELINEFSGYSVMPPATDNI
jgi:hypothetical protein